MTPRDCSPIEVPPSKCALIIGHPGHELRVLGWLAIYKPLVAVLTDGGGVTGRSRLDLTAKLLADAGAVASPLFGLLSDQQMYAALLGQDIELLLHLSDRLANLLVEHEIEIVAGDAIEGYNPAHDVCRLLIDRAVTRAMHRSGREIRNLTFALTGPSRPAVAPPGTWTITLDAGQLARKLAISRQYATTADGRLAMEIEQLIEAHGEAAFAEEVLCPMDSPAALARQDQAPPYYELHGQQRVQQGHYAQIIRYRQHMAPLAVALARG